MSDREKVMKGLECCSRLTDDYCETCPYNEILYGECHKLLKKGALELLKEQETIFLRDGHHVRCMHCGEYWCDSDREGDPFPMNFCPHCGKAVKWE